MEAYVAARMAATEGKRQERIREQERIAKVFATRHAALRDDPAGYAIGQPVVGAALKALTERPDDPNGARDYATSTLAVQEWLGLPADARRVLSAEQVAQLAARFGKENAASLIRSLRTAWASAWPAVFAQLAGTGLLPAAALVIGTMNKPEQRPAAEALAEAAQMGVATLEEGLSPEVAQLVAQRVDAEMDGFRATTHGDGSKLDTVAQGAYQLALAYARADSPDEAARRAVRAVTGKSSLADPGVVTVAAASSVGHYRQPFLRRLTRRGTDAAEKPLTSELGTLLHRIASEPEPGADDDELPTFGVGAGHGAYWGPRGPDDGFDDLDRWLRTPGPIGGAPFPSAPAKAPSKGSRAAIKAKLTKDDFDFFQKPFRGRPPVRHKVGKGAKIAIIGRVMADEGGVPGVLSYAKELRRLGYDVELFVLPNMSVSAWRKWLNLTGKRSLTDTEVMATKLFKENEEWAKKVAREDYTVIDFGDAGKTTPSLFYNTEKRIIFGDP